VDARIEKPGRLPFSDSENSRKMRNGHPSRPQRLVERHFQGNRRLRLDSVKAAAQRRRGGDIFMPIDPSGQRLREAIRRFRQGLSFVCAVS
jgi:hypothetical protein